MGRTTDKIRKAIEIKENKLGRQMTEKERRNIIKQVKRKVARENFIRSAFLAVGITIGAGGHALLTAGENMNKQENNKQTTELQLDITENENNTFKENLKVDISQDIRNEDVEQQIDYEKIVDEVLEEYNNKYDMQLKADDISYVKTKPQFLGVDENGTYIQDYKQNTPVQEYLTNDIQDIYVMINKKDNTIISSLGKIYKDIKNIDTKVVMDYNRNEYFESDKKIDLTENKTKEEVEQIYMALENEYQKGIEEER